MNESPGIFRQAGAAESKTRPKIRPGQIQLAVLTEHIHYASAIYTLRLQKASGFVCERDFESVIDIAYVLYRFGNATTRAYDR